MINILLQINYCNQINQKMMLLIDYKNKIIFINNVALNLRTQNKLKEILQNFIKSFYY